MAANTNSIQFTSASSQYVTLPNVSALKPTGSFTVEAWVKTTTAAIQNVFASYSANTAIAGFALDVNNSGNIYAIVGKNTGTTASDFKDGFGTSTVLTDGSWHHLAMSYDGSNINIYIDTVLDTTLAWAGGVAYAATTYVQIGSRSNAASGGTPSEYFNGNIDEVRLWSTARTQAEIAANYQADVTGFSGLLAYWKCNDGSGTSLTEVVSGNNGTLVNTPTWSTTVPFANYSNATTGGSFLLNFI